MHEIDDNLRRSRLSRFEELFPLPLPCGETETDTAPPHIRARFTFFLAEMSLRAILESILTTPELGVYVCSMRESPASSSNSTRSACNSIGTDMGIVIGHIRLSPLIHELRSQIDTWILRLPTDLAWSFEPVCGVPSAQGTRLKLLYWYARFALHRPIMQCALRDTSLQSHLMLWEPFREALLPALNLIKVFVVERPDVDVFMADRYV